MSETTPNPPPEAGEAPTGWAILTKNQSVVEMIDTLLSLPPRREFHKTELAKLADVSRKSVHNHIDLLLELEIIIEVPDTVPQRYRFNPESDVSESLIKLDGAVNNAGPHAGE